MPTDRVLRSALIGALSVLAFGCQAKPPLAEPGANKRSDGQLRTVVVGEELPLVKKTDAGFDGLSFVFIEAIRDQLSHTDGKEMAIQTIPVKTLRDAQSLLEEGKADLACGVDFSWERQTLLDYTLPFATTGIRLLAPKGNDGTPDSLQGKTIGVVKDSVAASVLANNLEAATFKFFSSPSTALEALKDGTIEILGGDSLWLQASRERAAAKIDLVPNQPYARTSVACVVAEGDASLLDAGNLAIGRVLQDYVDGDQAVRKEINSWIGPGSAVGLSDDDIAHYYSVVLATVTEFQQDTDRSN